MPCIVQNESVGQDICIGHDFIEQYMYKGKTYDVTGNITLTRQVPFVSI